MQDEARKRIPGFIVGFMIGCIECEDNLRRNIEDIQTAGIPSHYMAGEADLPSLSTWLFGLVYRAPFGVAPMESNGLIWPCVKKAIAAAARDHGLVSRR